MAETIASLLDRLAKPEIPRPSIARIRETDDPREQHLRGKELGDANEARLLRVLKAGPLPRWLVDVRRGTAEEDRRGVDLVATTRTGLSVPIQVKSSGLRAIEFVAEHRARTGSRAWTIAIVVVRESESDAELLARAIDRIAAVLTPPAFSSHR